MNKLMLLSVAIALNAGVANARNHKLQDADYVNIVCSKLNGVQQKTANNGLRADCVTDKFAIEVDYAKDWRKNVDQALGYGKAFSLKPMLVLVVEEPSDETFYLAAEAYIKKNQPALTLDKVFNNLTAEESLQLDDEPVIKMSKKKICHVKKCGSYSATKKYTAFNSLAECERAGGTRAENLGEKLFKKCEKEATEAMKKKPIVQQAKAS